MAGIRNLSSQLRSMENILNEDDFDNISETPVTTRAPIITQQYKNHTTQPFEDVEINDTFDTTDSQVPETPIANMPRPPIMFEGSGETSNKRPKIESMWDYFEKQQCRIPGMYQILCLQCRKISYLDTIIHVPYAKKNSIIKWNSHDAMVKACEHLSLYHGIRARSC